MNGFFSLVWFVTLIAFIVYWRKKVGAKKNFGADSEEYAKVSKIKRIIGIVCIIAFVGSAATAPSKNESTDNAATTQAEQTQTKEEKEAAKAAEKEALEAAKKAEKEAQLKSLWEEIVAIDDSTNKAWNDVWAPTMTALGNGQMDRFTAYNNIKGLYEYTSNQWQKAHSLKTPSSLEGDDKKMIDEAINSYTTALYSQKEAAEDMKDLLDKGRINPSDLDSIKGNIDMAQSFKIQAIANIVSVAHTNGIELTQNK